jgi:mannose-6-phosphate isomerase
MRPIELPPNLQRHFYAGGPRIAALRGLDIDADRMPEEWIGAVSTMFGRPDRGLSRLADGTLLRDAVAADPEAYLGHEHVARFGPDPGLLVKLLDAGQRLPVHLHPGREFARDALDSAHGKTEAWIIIEADPGATVHVGWSRAVEHGELREWMNKQDANAMLDAMHERRVSAGDAIFVPAGTAHAIGAGILLVELQEPTDFSILLEWEGFPLTEEQAHLGLGWERALEALDRDASGDIGPREGLLPAAANPYFRAERRTAGSGFDPGFSILIGLGGSGTLATEGGDLPFARGSAVLVPHAAGAGELRGDVAAIRCRPPDPAAGAGPTSRAAESRS